jgi:hypothetical protein
MSVEPACRVGTGAGRVTEGAVNPRSSVKVSWICSSENARGPVDSTSRFSDPTKGGTSGQTGWATVCTVTPEGRSLTEDAAENEAVASGVGLRGVPPMLLSQAAVAISARSAASEAVFLHM